VDPLLAADDLSLRVGVGSERRVPLRVTNPADTPDSYRLEVLGEPGRWSRVEPRHVPDVPPGEELVVQLVLQPPVGTPTGVLPIGVRCESLQDSTRCAVVEGVVTIATTQELEVSAVAVTPRGRHTGRFVVDVRNLGTAPADVSLSATDPREELGFALAPRELTVLPGESDRAYLSARVRHPKLAGATITHRFSVEHRLGAGPKGRLPVRFDQRPVLGAAATAGAVLLTLALATGAGVLVWPTVREALAGGAAAAVTTAAAPTSAGVGSEPVQGFYVLWAATPVDDVAATGTLEGVQARLRAAGVDARIVDGRDSEEIKEPGGRALRVLVGDGFPSLSAAQAECAARRALAPNCTAGPT
jgi:hypothetical protein